MILCSVDRSLERGWQCSMDGIGPCVRLVRGGVKDLLVAKYLDLLLSANFTV